ncbi:tRNA pseudouridine(55) synthase TruB [Clostridiaceae bacterium 35-E11]
MKSGIINILKPPNMTSHDVVNFLRKIFNTKKVGHTGTLDPMAAGVLPICIGNATKISQYLLNDTKKYRCEMILGGNTDTQDRWGNILTTRSVNINEKDIIDVFHSFKGEIAQVPPMYSAIKHKGKKLYELARKGETVERAERKVFIYELDIIRIKNERILFDVLCSKGTYVRTLCEDIGNQLGCGAYMSFLLRTQSGRFTLGDSVTLERLENTCIRQIEEAFLIPMDYPLVYMSKVKIKTKSGKYLLNGNNIYLKNIESYDDLPLGSMVRLYLDDKFIALGKVRNDKDQIYVDIDRVFN